MKRLFIIFLAILMTTTFNAFPQAVESDSLTTTTVEKKKLTKEEKKEARWKKKEQKELERSRRKLEDFQRKQRNLVAIKENVNDSLFVLEATNLYDRYGRSIPVSPSINFIAVAGDTLVMQMGSDFAVGPNGVGGITLEGRIVGYEANEGPGPGNINVMINAKSVVLGLATISINVNQNGTFRASVRGSWRQQLQMSGDFQSWETSNIFKGRTSRLFYGPY